MIVIAQIGEPRCNTSTFGLHETAAHGRLMGQRRTAQRAKRRTVLSTPSATNGKEAVDS